jgi:hypothetical protein
MEWDIHCDELTKRFLGADHLLDLTETHTLQVVDGTNGMEQYLKCTIRNVNPRNVTDRTQIRRQQCKHI